MSISIEAIYEDGVLRPLAHYNLKEHRRYRLLILDEIAAPSRLPTASGATMMAERTTTLRDGRNVVNLLGLFQGVLDLGFAEIEVLLDEFRTEQQQEWEHDTIQQELS